MGGMAAWPDLQVKTIQQLKDGWHDQIYKYSLDYNGAYHDYLLLLTYHLHRLE